MPITSFITDRDAATITAVAEFPVTLERLWDAYADPRQLEQFWCPPDYPATFFRHDMFTGGQSRYGIANPDGKAVTPAGFWEFVSVDAPNSFVVNDYFAHADGTPNKDMPAGRMEFRFEPTPKGSRLTCTSMNATPEQLDELIAMGVEEGTQAAMGQIDAVLADEETFSASKAAMVQYLGESRVRISRILDATVMQVWNAHHDADLLSRWQLGPEGWSMPECVAATAVGDRFRYVWREDATGEAFGSTGEILESMPPRREIHTERMDSVENLAGDGPGDPGIVNEFTLTPLSTGTLLTYVINYRDDAMRDEMIGTGMVDGMEFGYGRLEKLLKEI